MKLSMIACVGKNLELGKNNDLIWHLPKDLKYFKKVTDGKVVVMGKNTFKSLPGVLKNRKNIVLTFPNDNEILPEEVYVFHGIEEFLDSYKNYPDEIFIIGGASIYQQFIDKCSTLYLTEVNEVCPDASVYFPKFNKEEYKKEVVGSACDKEINYQFTIYRRK